jgi:hypothetical protein
MQTSRLNDVQHTMEEYFEKIHFVAININVVFFVYNENCHRSARMARKLFALCFTTYIYHECKRE